MLPRIDLLSKSVVPVAEALGARSVTIVTQDASLADRSRADDYDLVLQASNGDLAAYSELVERHQRAVYGIVSRMVTSRDDVDDLVQDVFVLAYKSLDRFRGGAAFGTWLHSIAVNTTLKHMRKMKIRQTTSVDDNEFVLETALTTEPEESPSALAEDSERKAAVRAAVQELPEKHRAVVMLRYFEDYSCEEIAKMMNCSVGTVWSRLHYACKQLKGQLGWLETA